MSTIYRCCGCLNMSTRPRIEFDADGYCNACQWAKEKPQVDWGRRQEELRAFLAKQRGTNTDYDCIVPVSGGKDGSYVSYVVKHRLGLNPLCVTINPPLPYALGLENLKNFSKAGYDLLAVTPNPEMTRRINKIGLLDFGTPLTGWLLAMQAYIPKLAVQMKIPLIIYGEDGEVEYGGSSASKNVMAYTVDYSKRIYLIGAFSRLLQEKFSEKELAMFTYPTDKELAANNVTMTHWSYFEAWDSHRNYLIAKEHFGLQSRSELEESGTYGRFAQNDTCLYDLHTYIMFLKFGFGRATQDASIDIRRGAMTREQGIELVLQHDDWCPTIYFDQYCDYYEISMAELEAVFDTFVNKDLLHKRDGRWVMKRPIF